MHVGKRVEKGKTGQFSSKEIQTASGAEWTIRLAASLSHRWKKKKPTESKTTSALPYRRKSLAKTSEVLAILSNTRGTNSRNLVGNTSIR